MSGGGLRRSRLPLSNYRCVPLSPQPALVWNGGEKTEVQYVEGEP